MSTNLSVSKCLSKLESALTNHDLYQETHKDVMKLPIMVQQTDTIEKLQEQIRIMSKVERKLNTKNTKSKNIIKHLIDIINSKEKYPLEEKEGKEEKEEKERKHHDETVLELETPYHHKEEFDSEKEKNYEDGPEPEEEEDEDLEMEENEEPYEEEPELEEDDEEETEEEETEEEETEEEETEEEATEEEATEEEATEEEATEEEATEKEATEEEATEEEATEEEATEEEVEEEEVKEEEATEEEVEEEEVEEEEVEEEKATEKDGKKEEEKEEEEGEEVMEVEIHGVAYYADNETNGEIYEKLPNEEVGNVIGNYKNGIATINNLTHLPIEKEDVSTDDVEVEEVEIKGKFYYTTNIINGEIYEKNPDESVGDVVIGNYKKGIACFL